MGSVEQPQISHAEFQLAGYVLARELDGRALSDASIGKLVTASEAMTVTRDAFSYGRANVVVDTALHESQNRYRGFLGRQIAKKIMLQVPRDGRSESDFARAHRYVFGATGSFVGSGFCTEHSATAVVALARTMSAGELVNRARSTVTDHEWTEQELVPHDRGGALAGQAHGSGRESPIVLDAWCDGPAMKSTDTRLAKDRRQVLVDLPIRYEERNITAHAFGRVGGILERDYGEKIEALIDENKATYGEWSADNPRHCQPSPVVDPEFAKRARNLIEDRGQDEVMRLAAGVAEKMFALSPEAAAQAAPSVVRAAGYLDEIGPARGVKQIPSARPQNDTHGVAGETREL